MEILKERSCTLIFVMGIIIGFLIGAISGVNLATWFYADIVSSGYTEIIRTSDGSMFINEKGSLFTLQPVVTNSGVDVILDVIKKHDKNMESLETKEPKEK